MCAPNSLSHQPYSSDQIFMVLLHFDFSGQTNKGGCNYDTSRITRA